MVLRRDSGTSTTVAGCERTTCAVRLFGNDLQKCARCTAVNGSVGYNGAWAGSDEGGEVDEGHLVQTQNWQYARMKLIKRYNTGTARSLGDPGASANDSAMLTDLVGLHRHSGT